MNDIQESSRELGSASPVCRADMRWPARTQRLLGELRLLCSNWLHEPLRRTLDHFDMRLHGQAERTRSHLDQQNFLTTRQHLRKEHQKFGERFIASIQQAFDHLDMPPVKSNVALPQTLSLLDPLEHEVAAALDQLVARSEARGGPQLVELRYRLAVLIGTPPVESEALPMGPQAMARAFREASHLLGLPSIHELLLLQNLESSLIQELASLYDLVNAHLRADGILPRLRPFSLPRTTARRDSVKLEKKALSVAPTTVAMVGSEPERMVDKVSRGGAVVTDEELQFALAALQQHLLQADERTRYDLSRPQRLREELLIQLNVGQPNQSIRTNLSTQQDDTVELIVRLFGQIAQQLPSASGVQSLLWDLQLPMLRIALNDHGFFEQQEHAARKILGKIAEIAHDWLDDASGGADRGLRTKLAQLVERTGREPPSVALYASLQADLDQYLTQLQYKTQLAERRQVEAMQGLERLEQARHRTAELLAKRFVKSSPQHLPLARLDHAWSDVLALTLLRHGEQSAIFGTRLAIADQLLGCLPIGNRHKLQQEVEAGLQQIGIQSDDVVQVAHRMISASRNELTGHALNTHDLAPDLRGHQRLATPPLQTTLPSVNSNPVNTASSAPAITPSSEVLRIHRHLRALPSGIWFEFVDPSHGSITRRKLVWYSSLSGHSLFVTRSGQRAEKMGELQLAHAIVCARVREIASDHEEVFDRAWRVVTQELGQQRRPITFGRSP